MKEIEKRYKLLGRQEKLSILEYKFDLEFRSLESPGTGEWLAKYPWPMLRLVGNSFICKGKHCGYG